MPPKLRRCAFCEAELPEDAPKLKKYCDQNCRQGAARKSKRKKSLGGKKSPLTPAMQEYRKLIEAEDDFVRDAMQEAVREIVTEHVKDNILGAAEILTGMLPRVLAGLAKDIESKDWMIRSRAQAAILKYAMEFKDKTNSEQDLGTINVIHNVALPDTPLGAATAKAGEVITIEAGEVEAFEASYEQCQRCGDRHPPEAMRQQARGTWLCTSCLLARNYERGKVSPSGFLDRDPEFGTPGRDG